MDSGYSECGEKRELTDRQKERNKTSKQERKKERKKEKQERKKENKKERKKTRKKERKQKSNNILRKMLQFKSYRYKCKHFNCLKETVSRDLYFVPQIIFSC